MEENKLSFIENELKKFNVTDMALNELSENYMPLKINGIDDKEGAKAVAEAKKIVKRYRIDVDKRRKELNADALEYQRRINGEAKRIISILEPIETHLADEEKRIEDELERIKREKEEAETIKFQTRIKQLLALDFKFDGVRYISDYLDTFTNELISVATLHLKQMDDAAFTEFHDNAKHYYDVAKQEAIEKEKQRQEQLAREDAERKAENERLAAERARLDAIAKEQAEKEAKLKAEAEKIEATKRYEESKQAVIDSEIECQNNGCTAPIHERPTLVINEVKIEDAPNDDATTDHERGYHEGFLSALETVYELAKNLSKEDLLKCLQEEINERK